MKSLHSSYSRASAEDDTGETETIPFLDSEKQSTDSSSSSSSNPGHAHGRSEPQRRDSLHRVKALLSSRWLLVHSLVVALYTGLFVFLVVRKSLLSPSLVDPRSQLGLYSPLTGVVEYEARAVDGLAEGSVYAGYPRPESEAAWKTLMQGSNVKIYSDEMVKLKETSLEMRDGSGSLAVLGVYHELHCVKRLRKWFYKEYYYPNQTELEYNERFTHAEHCLEFLRQAAMCHGDITVTSFKWLHDARGHVIEPTTKEGALHQCVKWEGISGWAQKRRVNLFDPKLLVPEGGHVEKPE